MDRTLATIGAGTVSRRCASAALAAALLLGCASAPRVTSFESTRSYSKSYDDVWRELMQFFTSYNLQIKTVEKESGIVYAERLSFDNVQADCGHQWPFVPLSRTLSLNVFVATLEESGSTQVTVNADFRERRQNNLNPVQTQDFVCHSTGVVEQAVLGAIR